MWISQSVIWCAGLLSSAFAATAAPPGSKEVINGIEVHTFGDFIKGNMDSRDYHLVTLPNELQILFVSDPEARKVKCSSIGVG